MSKTSLTPTLYCGCILLVVLKYFFRPVPLNDAMILSKGLMFLCWWSDTFMVKPMLFHYMVMRKIDLTLTLYCSCTLVVLLKESVPLIDTMVMSNAFMSRCWSDTEIVTLMLFHYIVGSKTSLSPTLYCCCTLVVLLKGSFQPVSLTDTMVMSKALMSLCCWSDT